MCEKSIYNWVEPGSPNQLQRWFQPSYKVRGMYLKSGETRKICWMHSRQTQRSVEGENYSESSVGIEVEWENFWNDCGGSGSSQVWMVKDH